MAEGTSSGSGLEESVVTEECLRELLDFFVKNAYRAKTVDRRYEIIHKMCLHLVARDYRVEVLDNKAGQLCGHYPAELIVIEGHLHQGDSARHRVNNAAQLKELFTTARFARCRSRFVMPVMLFEDKNICRSATLSTMAELYGRSGVDWIFTGGEGIGMGGPQGAGLPDAGLPPISNDSESVLLNRVRGQDIQLMKTLQITFITDLMVENKKIKYGIPVSSSEKVDKWARYADFLIASLPYPGCEFFKEYKDNGYNPVGLHFNWNQPSIDADLAIPDVLQHLVPVNFQRYQDWDLVEITQSYLRLLLSYLKFGEGGVLIHCISGWDRTPLLISLLRLSLWADGKVHQSLCPTEMLYFTLAYDWLIYGHQLKERHEKGEEIMYFCFDFLKYITSDEYSVCMPTRSTSDSRLLHSSGGLANTYDHVRANEQTDDSSYELGESWVGVDGLFMSSSLANGERPRDSRTFSMTGSWQHVSVNGPSTSGRHSRIVSSLAGDSFELLSSIRGTQSGHEAPVSRNLREKKLNCVRQLFLKIYKSSIPPVQEQPSGISFSGLFSRLAGTTFV